MKSSVQRKMVKKTVIPVHFHDDPQSITGMIHFPTENSHKVLYPHTANVTKRKFSISYKRQIQEHQEQDNQNPSHKKKQVEYFDIILQPKKTKDKQFKVEVPVTRGHKSQKGFNRLSQIFFNFSFTNSQGRLALINGIQDAKMQILKTGRVLNSKQKVQIQLSMLDNRRNKPINQSKYLKSDNEDNSESS